MYKLRCESITSINSSYFEAINDNLELDNIKEDEVEKEEDGN